jgi:hypothetical protein
MNEDRVWYQWLSTSIRVEGDDNGPEHPQEPVGSLQLTAFNRIQQP